MACRRLRRIVVPLSLPLALLWHTGACAITIGVLAPEGGALADRAWQSTRASLSARLGREVELRFGDIAGLRAAVASGSVDFVIASSGLYVELEAAHGASRIATLESPFAPNPAEAIAATVLVRSRQGAPQGLEDLRGRRIAIIGTEAFGGWQVALPEFARAGLDAERDLVVETVGFPMQEIVRRVIEGRADAGIVRNCVLEGMVARGEVPAGAVRVLRERTAAGERCARTSALYPDWPFATLRHTPRELAREAALALFAMPADADGLRWTVPVDYQPVRELFRELRIGPYAYLREQTLEGLVRRWWWVVALAAIALAGGAAHIARAEWLVRARTRELHRSIEERERLSREAREQQERLDHLARLGALGEISSMLAHELAQPLAAIGNFARGIVRRLEAGRTDPAPIAGAAADIAAEAERAAGILSRIRDFSRKRPAHRESLDLREPVDGAIRLFAAALADAPKVKLTIACRLPPRVWADRLQLEQVLLNLLKNAYDATRDRAAAAEIRLDIEDHEAGLLVRVADNGAGLDEATRQRMFEPFFTTKPDGVGLGLALAQRVAEAHGGRLRAQPASPAGGLAVCLLLPRADERHRENGTSHGT